jgi:type II secretory pathway component GspD/PulD (secretin)
MLSVSVRAILLASLLSVGLPAGGAAGKESVRANPSPPLAITVEHGLVSVNLQDAPLSDALHAVGERAGVQITIYKGSAERVTESFTGVALEEAIERLARGYQLVWIYGSPMGSATSLAEVRVYLGSPGAPAGGSVVVGPPTPVEEPARNDLPGMASLVGQPTPGREELIQRRRDERLTEVRAIIEQARQQAPGALDTLTAILTGEPDPTVRQVAATSLAGNSRPEVVAALTTAVGDENASVRSAAISALGQMRNEAMTPLLQEMLAGDPDAAVRRAAAWALAGQNSDDARRGLENAASDPDAWVRQAAVSALAQWQQRAKAKAL